MRRLKLAFIVAPLAPFFVYIIFGPYILLALAIGAPVSYFGAFLCALLYHYKIKYRPNLQKGRYCVMIAGALGVFMGAPFCLIGSDLHTRLMLMMLYGLLGLLHGVIAGAVFWMIARPKKNSNTAKKIEKMPKPADITAYDFFAKLMALPFVEAVYLYGSRARGDHDDWSDIDLAVLCPQATRAEWAQVIEALETEEILVPITAARYDTITDAGFKAQIDRDKKELYARG